MICPTVGQCAFVEYPQYDLDVMVGLIKFEPDS